MSFGDEYAGKYHKKPKSKLKPFMPVIGLFLALIAAGVAYFLSEPVLELLQDNVSGLPRGDEALGLQVIVGIVIFALQILVLALIYAAIAPKPTKLTTEKQMAKEKADMQREMRAAKRRKRKLAYEMTKAES